MVKRLPNWLKIGLQLRFGPNFTVEFEAFFRKKFGLAYCTGTSIIYCQCQMTTPEKWLVLIVDFDLMLWLD